MGNEYGAADLQPHLGYGLHIHYLADVKTAVGTKTIIAGGYHQKMRLRHAYYMVVNVASTNPEASIALHHGGNAVVAAVDIGAASANPPVGNVQELTIVDQYKDLDPEDALEFVLSVVDGTASAKGLVMLEYELVE